MPLAIKRRQHNRQRRVALMEEADEAWHRNRQAEAMKACRVAAFCRYGSRKRDGRPFSPAPPTAAGWLATWQRE
eukprot:820854-Pyramimonas_sp.AAC.1